MAKVFFQYLFVCALLGVLVLILVATIASCYFFITTFTLSDFEERTTSFILGIVSSFFTYGVYHVFMCMVSVLNDKLKS